MGGGTKTAQQKSSGHISVKKPSFLQIRSPVVHGFTLVELLVVITIIGLLVGLFSLGIPLATNTAKKAKAKAEALAIVSAIKAYNNEYSKYPNPTSDTNGDDVWMQGTNSKNLMKILAGQDIANQNPKKVRFIEGPNADGVFQDPWQKGDDKGQYTIKVDMSGDGVVEFYGNIQLPVLVMSTGQDTKLKNPSDPKSKNVYSWK